MKKPENKNQESLFVVDTPDDDVKAVVHQRSVFRIRVHPFTRFKGWDYTRDNESDAISLVAGLKKRVSADGAIIVVEKDTVLHCLHVLEKGRWTEEKQC